MCFAPQRRALFRDLNFQKWSEPLVFLTFWLPNVLRATTACIFFHISTSKNGPYMVCFVHFDLEMRFAPQRRALFRHLNFQKWSEPPVFLTVWLPNVLRATTACTVSTSQLPKVVREWCVLYILSSKCASRHNAVHFFNISTSKSGPNPSVFNTFYFQMCFAPQRRALFQHLNFQKWSDPEVFCTFTPRNWLRATTGCNSLISPDVSAPAALASLLFNPPEPQNHEKTQWCFATFLPFRAPASSFFWSFLFWLFSLLTAFSSLHIVGSLTSKLPSNKSFNLLSFKTGDKGHLGGTWGHWLGGTRVTSL